MIKQPAVYVEKVVFGSDGLRFRRILFMLSISIVLSFGTPPALAVRSPEYYEERVEASFIKAVAVVEEVRVLEASARSTRKEVLFRLERSLGKDVPARFSGICFYVDREGQEPGAGGTVYYYPEKGVRALVTVNLDGGIITSYTPLSEELDRELRQNGLRNIAFPMGRAVVRKATDRSRP
ncbi:MAG: hypothetical protein C4576_24580 [Desulfobacteraceae bacterium]|nr:MAG: hypothetical protein C4576_24580 [Desulfobacteraceae bacterium]